MTDQRFAAAAAPVEILLVPQPRHGVDEPVAHPVVHPLAHPVEHRVRLAERGPFVVAQCIGCGWESFARRSRPLARREAGDHELLHRPAATN